MVAVVKTSPKPVKKPSFSDFMNGKPQPKVSKAKKVINKAKYGL